MIRGEPELTPFERELQDPGASEGRGHTPSDNVAEPTVAPGDPAGIAVVPDREPLPSPAADPADEQQR